jgi:uncharacterized membrane protein YcaP (DUF421 family)
MVFFQSWTSLGRTALVGICAYAGLVLFLRISGKRTLAKMNAFDLVVTVALGSTLATVLTSRQTPLADGLGALALLICLQYGVAWLAVRLTWFRRIIKSEPTLLFHQGQFLSQALHRERVTQDDIVAAVRNAGIPDLSQVQAVVLETDGSCSVLRHAETAPQHPSLAHVRHPAGTTHSTAEPA